jgi:arginine/lysine/ornithine decarboxylase
VRKYLATEGEALFAAALERALDRRQRLDAIPGVEVFEADRLVGEPGVANDPFRLVVRVAGLGKSGFETEEFLRNEYRIEDEFSDFENVIYILTPFDPPEVYDRLVAGLTRLADDARANGRLVERTDYAEASELPLPALACTPREAYSAKTRVLPIADAVGSPCGETIVCYPPGIPIICAGEIVDANTVETLRRFAAQKASMRAHDMTLATVTVLDV